MERVLAAKAVASAVVAFLYVAEFRRVRLACRSLNQAVSVDPRQGSEAVTVGIEFVEGASIEEDAYHEIAGASHSNFGEFAKEQICVL